MSELLWINACMRGAGHSRTLGLCQTFLDAWKEKHPDWTVTERDLTAADIPVMTAAKAMERDQAVREGRMDSPLLAIAQEMARADRIVIGTPYWDLSFPAILKVYLEWASTMDITFHYTDQGQSEGICKADKLLYITTAGGPVEGQNYGYDYIQGLCRMWGIGQSDFVAAPFTDVIGGPIEESLRNAKEQLLALAPNW